MAEPSLTLEDQMLEELGSYAYDPLAFVYWAFPWGEAGTELSEEDGPDEWQIWVLSAVRDKLISLDTALLLAVTSGHGIGKSALVGWLVLWAYSTFPGTRGVVTANTENQLKTKTWVEIAKWTRLFIARDLFKLTATALFSKDEAHSKEWRIDIVPWSERNTEAFAGLHNAGKRILIIFDEASAIPEIIWETTQGALTDKDTEIMWFVFGNPTRNDGRFRECFPGGKFDHRWLNREVDSRTVKRSNKQQLQNWIDDYGLDSDFVRVRVLGKFPHTDANSFISREIAEAATIRIPLPNHRSVVLGVDVARFGDDLSVIYPRKGRDASTIPPRVFSGLGIVALSKQVILAANELEATAIFVDGGGVGGGVVDILRDLSFNVYDVQFGARADGLLGAEKFMNKRAEIWGMMREFLKDGSIPVTVKGRSLINELISPTYSLNAKDMIQLESKDMMKRRGVDSPDVADALACTFAFPFAETAQISRKTPVSTYNPYQAMEAYR